MTRRRPIGSGCAWFCWPSITKMRADTIAMAVHFLGGPYPVGSTNSGVPSQCTSTGRAERKLIDDVARRVADRR